jgi:hypothetical protein
LFCAKCCPTCTASPPAVLVEGVVGGFIDLIDDRLLVFFRDRSQHAKTHAQRESAKRLVCSVEIHRKWLASPSAAQPSPELLDALDERSLADLRERAERGAVADRQDAQRLLRAWEARQSQVQGVRR